MTSEQLLKWMNDSELDPEKIADATRYKASYLRNVFCGSAPVSALLKRRLKKAYPDDLELVKILDGCPHCWDGLQDDNDDGPVYCERCRLGILRKLDRIQGTLDGLHWAVNDCDVDGWVVDHMLRTEASIQRHQETHAYLEHQLEEMTQ